MYQYKRSDPKVLPQGASGSGSLQLLHKIGNSASLEYTAPTIQRIRLTINDYGNWFDASGIIHEDIEIDLHRLCPGAVYDTDMHTITLPNGSMSVMTIPADEEEGPEYTESGRGYILSSSTLKNRRYRYLSSKLQSAKLPPKKDWAKRYNAHHIIPNEVVRDHIKPSDTNPYNDPWNCIMLPNLRKASARNDAFVYKGKSGNKHLTKPLHANHPNYNQKTAKYIARKLNKDDDDTTKLEKAKELAITIRSAIHRNTKSPQIRLDDMRF